MRVVPRRHTAPQTVPPESPWCACKGRGGYKQHPDHDEEYFVHADCMKPTQAYGESRCA